MTNAYSFTLVDADDLIGSAIEEQITKCALYVVSLVGRYIEWQGTLDFTVIVKPDSQNTNSDADGLLPSVGQISTSGVNETLEECMTGIDRQPSLPDAGCTIYLAADGSVKNYGTPVWFDPNPQFEVDPAVPAGMHDFVGIYTHEVFHGLGFWPTTQWSEQSVVEDGVGYFLGAQTVALYGDALPFEPANTHFGSPDHPDIASGLMYRFGNYDRNRWDIDRTSLAVLSDLGHAIRTYDSLARFELIDTALDLQGSEADDRLFGDYHPNRLEGKAGADRIQAGSGDDVADGGAGDDQLYGESGHDMLTGGEGVDLLDGGPGGDGMTGGADHDTYYVDSSTDVVNEEADGGIDAVYSSIAFTLPAHFEHLWLIGTSAVAGTGNALANILNGNAAANRLDGLEGDDALDGRGGADEMWGGDGDDVYSVDHGLDRAIESSAAGGIDVVLSTVSFILGANVEKLYLMGDAPVDGTGNDLVNSITGNGLANRLDGGTGADTLAGGLGDDIYVVDQAGDIVSEAAGEGTDTVLSAVNWILGANLENLTLTGSANNATGNDLANRLDGGAGADSMAGGLGDDIYVVDQAGDSVTETAGQGTDTVLSGVNWILGANLENLILIGTAAYATGNTLANQLTGNASANVLNGGLGADTMAGGAGDDTYVVENVLDRAVENAGSGNDLVSSSVSFTLGANVERLTLTGGAAINGAGNAVANSLIGNAAANRLDGGAGADAMAGGRGNDIYVVDQSGDSVTETAGGGSDTVLSAVNWMLGANIENLTLTGSATHATGNGLANRLDGGTGADTLAGGLGDDVYVVDQAGDTVVEAAGGGTDTVQSAVNFVLGANVENLTLTGGVALYATGNALANRLTGNALANTLNGGAGADTMAGGLGDDVYIADNVLDRAVEAAGAGNDLVNSSVSFTLGLNVERLTLTGGAAVDGTGNSLANTLTGNAAANRLEGGIGADRLAGGGGIDTFVYRSLADSTPAAAGRDLIADFKGDKIDLSLIDAIAGTAANDAFDFIGTAAFSHTAGELRMYQAGPGWYVAGDVDGDAIADLLIGVTPSAALTAADFVL